MEKAKSLRKIMAVLTTFILVFGMFGIFSIVSADAPSVTIVKPTKSLSVMKGYTLILSARLADFPSVSKVEFYSGATKIGEVLTPDAPSTANGQSATDYTFEWPNMKVGMFSLTAKGYDDESGAPVAVVSDVRVVNCYGYDKEEVYYEDFETVQNLPVNNTANSNLPITNYQNASTTDLFGLSQVAAPGKTADNCLLYDFPASPTVARLPDLKDYETNWDNKYKSLHAQLLPARNTILSFEESVYITSAAQYVSVTPLVMRIGGSSGDETPFLNFINGHMYWGVKPKTYTQANAMNPANLQQWSYCTDLGTYNINTWYKVRIEVNLVSCYADAYITEGNGPEQHIVKQAEMLLGATSPNAIVGNADTGIQLIGSFVYQGYRSVWSCYIDDRKLSLYFPNNEAPEAETILTVTNDTTNTAVLEGTAKTLSATIADSEGLVTGVGFYDNGVLIGTVPIAESVSDVYTYNYTAPFGTHNIVAKGLSGSSAICDSAAVAYNVNAPAGTFRANIKLNINTMNATANVLGFNDTGAPVNCVLIMALYDSTGTQLVDTYINGEFIFASNATITTKNSNTFALNRTGTDLRKNPVKAFLWTDTGDIIPLAACVTVNDVQ